MPTQSFYYQHKIPGWNPYEGLNTYYKGDGSGAYNDRLKGDMVPFCKLPNSIVPASKIIGTAFGMSTPQRIVGRVDYYLGGQRAASACPTLGYCIGDIYKEHVYFFMSNNAYNDFSFKPDVYQRSRLKRIYINHGKIISFRREINSGVEIGLLSIDYGKKMPPSVLSTINSNSLGKIKIYKNKLDGAIHEYTLDIQKIRDNWIFETTVPPDETDSSGNTVRIEFSTIDFYILDNKSFCVEDPLMMSGQWWGKDDEKNPNDSSANVTTMPNSGLGLHITEHNKPYDKVAFTGSYIWTSNIANSTVTIVPSQTPLDSVDNGEWLWIPFSSPSDSNYEERYPKSTQPFPNTLDAYRKFYGTNKRYKYQYITTQAAIVAGILASNTSSNTVSSNTTSYTYTESSTSTHITVDNNVYSSVTGSSSYIIQSGNVNSFITPIPIEFKQTTETKIQEWKDAWANIKTGEKPYIRMELNRGGGAFYQNWHAPTLSKCWLVQTGGTNSTKSYFRIVNQPNGNVIDIELKDETGTVDLTVSSFATGEIFNQHAWMLNEHYMTNYSYGSPNYLGFGNSGSSTGVFQGNVVSSTISAGNTKVNIKTELIPSVNYTGSKYAGVCGTLGETRMNEFSGTFSLWPWAYAPSYLYSNSSSENVYVAMEEVKRDSNGYLKDHTYGGSTGPGQNKNNCFYNRFRLNPKSDLETATKMILAYDKMYNWKLVVSNGSSVYDTIDISFSDFPVNWSQQYEEIVTIPGEIDLSSIVGGQAYITFDTPYKLSRSVENNVSSNVTQFGNLDALGRDINYTLGPPNGGEYYAESQGYVEDHYTENALRLLEDYTKILEGAPGFGGIGSGNPGGGLDFGTPPILLPPENKPTIFLNWKSHTILENIPKNTFVGVCGGKHWGAGALGSSFLYSQEGNLLFFATYMTKGLVGISSLYNKYVQEDWLAYRDPYSKITTIRRGMLDCREQPRKSEVSIGNSKAEITIASSPYSITQTDNTLRLRKISFDAPLNDSTGATMGQCLIAAIKNPNSIHGNIISGKGQVDLQMLRRQGFSNGTISATNYKFNEFLTSPIYVYKRNLGDNFSTKNSFDIGASPVDDSPIYLIDVSNAGSVSSSSAQYSTSIKAEYVNKNQMLENNGYFDIHKLEDGEEIIIYGHPVSNFTINGATCDGEKWVTQNAIFIIGNGTEAKEWGCPLIKTLKYDRAPLWGTSAGAPAITDFIYPLMVAPSSEYLGSVYHYGFRRLFIFARGYANKSTSFIGCYSISMDSLLYKAYIATTSPYLNFIYRPLSLPPGLFNNIDESPFPIATLLNLPTQTLDISRDRFSKALKIERDVNTICPFVTNDGTLAMLYDTEEGIRMTYSRNTASFKEIPIVIVKDVTSPLLIDNNVLVFISYENGIGIKIAVNNNLYSAMKLGDMDNTAGNYITSLEAIEREIDAVPTVYIGSGKVKDQKLTGYKTESGIYKIFYYEENGSISCMTSDNLRYWKYHPNF